MFRTRRLANSSASGSDPDLSRSKKQRVVDSVKILLDIAKESADWFPPLKSALSGVNALVKHYEEFKDVKERIEGLKPQLDRLKQAITTTTIDGDPEETKRRTELTSTLAEIERRSQELLAKGTAARFVDKAGDSGEVAKLIERLREAIIHYQVSQQQAIYDRITDLASSFDALLKLHERSPSVKNKLDSIMARLDRLCSEEDSNNLLWGDNEHKRWAKLFDALKLIGDNCIALYNRVSAEGYQECQGDILAVSGMAEDIRDALLEYQTIQQRAMFDQNCKLIDAAHLSALNSCRRARGAGYRHGNRRGCLRGTRETVLTKIESWTKDFDKSPVFWLNGLAGTGKSTIAQTVAEHVFADGLLGASFFCSRDFEDRSDLHFIFPTLAFQLAHKYPDFRDHLVSLLQSNPDVVDESLCSQMGRLVVEPSQSAGLSTVIVIDALDECKDEEPSSAILSVLGRFVKQIPMVKFFITGRPEPRIKTGFRLPLLVESTDVFVLHDVHPSVINDDIRLFLKHELCELAQRRRLDRWPSDEDLDMLCRRASGLFIYAVASVKFLDSKIELPKRRLEVIAGLPDCTDHEGKTRFNTKTTLDSLYTSILEAAFGEENAEACSKVRSTIGAVILLVNPLPPNAIAHLIGLDPEEVIPLLTLVQSLLVFDEDSGQPVKPFHKSFPDFITDPSRCTELRFYISPGHLHLELVTNCLRVMNDGLEQDLLSLPDYTLNSEVEDLEERINGRISVALRYACQSWHNHLTKTRGEVTDVIPHLRVFLEENFLAWLEVVSVLGVVRGAVTALERLIHWLQETSGDKELLGTARDFFRFVTKFFEPINISAVHIYHSALELSPLSSIVRRLYHHRRRTPFPRVVVGIPDAWEECINLGSKSEYHAYTWSPCGRFVAAWGRETVDIRDPLSSELLSALTQPNVSHTGQLAYSPDGYSLASHSSTSLTIWDIQTGGMAREIECGAVNNVSLTWSLDGATICAIVRAYQGQGIDVPDYDIGNYSVNVHDVASGITLPSGTLQSRGIPFLWAHNTSFRVIAMEQGDQTFTINTFDVRSILTKVESFHIEPWEEHDRIGCFSPITYRFSMSNSIRGQLHVFGVWESECLLEVFEQVKDFEFNSHCFSSDGSLFAASLFRGVRIWEYTSGHYTLWREFLPWAVFTWGPFPPQFSPASSSILDRRRGPLQVWRLDSPPTVAHPDSDKLLAVISHCGTYIATYVGNSTVTITSLLSQTPSQFIDTDMDVHTLALTGNVLLVWGGWEIVAWRLTEKGTVYGVSADRGAGRGDSIWIVSSYNQLFSVEDQTLVMKDYGYGGNINFVYHTGTGEVLEPAKASPHPHVRQYEARNMERCQHYLHYRDFQELDVPSEDDWPVTWDALKEGWVKDLEGKHRLWVPVEWRSDLGDGGWLRNTTLLLYPRRETVIVMF